MRVYLKEPELEEYWYESKVLSDPLSMEYNAGWDVSYEGYDYQTGCINFPKEKWEKDYNRRKENNRYFAYVVTKENNQFIGYVNFHFNQNENKYYCGIVIEHEHRGKGYAKEALTQLCDIAFNQYNIDALYDNFDEARGALKTFESVGFKKTNEYQEKKFNKNIKIIEVSILKKEFQNK